jgi:hypothetical protein
MLQSFCLDGAGCRNCLRHRRFKRLAESFVAEGGGPDIRPA